MDLKDFIAETLSEIVDGVVEAQNRVSSTGAQINPKVHNVFVKSQSGGINLALGWAKNGEIIHIVDFDVAVTTTEGTETKSGIGVVAGVFALGSQGKSENTNTALSRIQFKVPITFPGLRAEEENT